MNHIYKEITLRKYYVEFFTYDYLYSFLIFCLETTATKGLKEV